jgi:hypothetical protein
VILPVRYNLSAISCIKKEIHKSKMHQKSALLFLLFCASLFIWSCERTDPRRKGSPETSKEVAKGVPPCVETKIQEIQNEPVRNPPAQLWKWEVDQMTYYYVSAQCCDFFSELYDEDCNLVCAPDGGIIGDGDGNCPVWSGVPVKTLLWEDQ